MMRFIVPLCFFILFRNTLSLEGEANSVTTREINGRIINGKNATAGQFPWQVLLILLSEDSLSACGGTIISEEWILTAAHCLDGANNATVTIGTVDLNLVPLQITAYEFISHEEYNATTLLNDIGLVRLPVPLTFNEVAAPITLSPEPLEGGEVVTVSGFGVTTDDTAVLINMFLTYINVTTITNSECAETYGDLILEDMVCTSAGTDPIKSACHGDSGGPAVLNADTEPLLVGISSFVSTRGCETGYPTGFTRISYYIDWIKEKTGV